MQCKSNHPSHQSQPSPTPPRAQLRRQVTAGFTNDVSPPAGDPGHPAACNPRSKCLIGPAAWPDGRGETCFLLVRSKGQGSRSGGSSIGDICASLEENAMSSQASLIAWALAHGWWLQKTKQIVITDSGSLRAGLDILTTPLRRIKKSRMRGRRGSLIQAENAGSSASLIAGQVLPKQTPPRG